MKRASIKIAAIIFSIIVSGILLVGEAAAIGLSILPLEVSVEGMAGKPTVARLKITNTSNDVALFEAYPDDLRSMIAISPASFTLQEGESRDIAITMNASAGRFETMISVVATPLSSDGLEAGAGIKIPLRASFADGEAGLLANISEALGAAALPVGIAVGALALFLRFFKISPRRKKEGE